MTLISSMPATKKTADHRQMPVFCRHLVVASCLIIMAGCQTNTQPQSTPAAPTPVSDISPTPIPQEPVAETKTTDQQPKAPLVIHLVFTTKQQQDTRPRPSAIALLEEQVTIPEATDAASNTDTSTQIPQTDQPLAAAEIEPTDSSPDVAAIEPAVPTNSNAQPLVKQIPPADQHQQLLDLASSMLAEGYVDFSLRLLQKITMELLPQASLGHYLETMATSYLLAGDSYTALKWLHKAETLDPDPTPVIRIKRLELLQQAYTDNEQFLPAALSAIELANSRSATSDSTAQLLANNNIIWNLLIQVPRPQLQAQLQTSPHPTARAWLELALSTRGLINLGLQQQAIQAWQLNNPLHPAALQFPRSLSDLVNLQPLQPQKLALLLPTSGPLGKLGQAVIDGFMANYYGAMAQCEKPCTSMPQLVFINSHKITD